MSQSTINSTGSNRRASRPHRVFSPLLMVFALFALCVMGSGQALQASESAVSTQQVSQLRAQIADLEARRLEALSQGLREQADTLPRL